MVEEFDVESELSSEPAFPNKWMENNPTSVATLLSGGRGGDIEEARANTPSDNPMR